MIFLLLKKGVMIFKENIFIALFGSTFISDFIFVFSCPGNKRQKRDFNIVMLGQFCTLVMFYDQIRVQRKPDTGLTEHLSKDTRGSRLQTSSNCAREGFCRSWLVVVHSIQPNLAVNSWKPL